MSTLDGSQRTRGTAYAAAADGNTPRLPRNGVGTAASGLSRAEKFEDEKKRFIESCFSKKDNDGSIIESYITHIRITEDAAYPTAPPPPSSTPDNKKPRLVVVAVRKSGRVRMHKARENANGTFSIGKTWVLDDLTAIQVYGNVRPSSQLEQQQKEWAASEGFLVTIGKPYYWQAATSKEKDFFIASLIKIYKKYTGGKVPDLQGFDTAERDALLGGSLPQAQPREVSSRSGRPERTEESIPPRPGSAQARPPLNRNRPPSREGSRDPGPPYQNRAPSREGNREGGTQARPFNRPGSRDGYLDQKPQPPYNRAPSREGSREPRKKPSEEMFLRKQASREQMQRAPGPFIPPRPRQDLTPQSSNSQLSRDQTSSPANSRTLPNGVSPTPPPGMSQPGTISAKFGAFPSTESVESSIGTQNTKATPTEPNRYPANKAVNSIVKDAPLYQRPETPPVNEARPSTRSGSPSKADNTQDLLPERRRPAFAGSANSFGQKSTRSDSNDKFSTPMTTPGAHEGDSRAPSRSSDRSTPGLAPTKSAGYFAPPSKPEDSMPIESNPPKVVEKIEESSQRSFPPDSLASVHDALSAPTPFSESPTPGPEPKREEAFRPGLGPMMKKKSSKDIARTLRMAATAYNAFKPRAGGAAERLLAEKERMTTEPDGITGVVPAPMQRGIEPPRSGTPDSMANGPLSPAERERPFSPTGGSFKQDPPPTVQITRTATDDVQPPAEIAQERTQSPDKSRSKSPGEIQGDRRRKRKSDNSAKYLTALGIDPSVLEGRGTEFDDVLTELGWNGRLADDKNIEELEIEVRREIGRAQSGSWLNHMEQQEGKIDQLSRMFDRCMEECEELDGLLTLYAHELNTLNDDIAYIEAQSQGLQVQTANQKLLQTELQNLLGTLSISSQQLLPLKEGSLATPDGVEKIETSLSTLYEAMIKIDPSMRQKRDREAPRALTGDGGKLGGPTEREVGSMRAVRERKEVYHSESLLFVQRLRQYMSKTFKDTARRTVESVERSQKQLRPQNYKADPTIHNGARQEIWLYNTLLLFTRDVDTVEWEGIMRTYEQSIKVVYQDEFRESIAAWTRTAKKPSGDEQDALFTTQEKEVEGITTAARKLTVKRGKTVRVAGTMRQSSAEKQDGKVEPSEAFAGALEEMATLISHEQNFIVHFFHASSHSNSDFVDAISAARPHNRSLPRLTSNQTYEPDREMAKRVSQTVEEIYPSWGTDLQNLTDWALKPDQLQVVGVLGAIETTLSEFEETNQEFLVRTLQKIHTSLASLFSRFVDEQIHGIEETKVKIKKRKGVIAFMRTFPHFSNVIEAMIPTPGPSSETLEVRYSVNDAYVKINRAMWESLKFIAKESPVGQTGGGGDPEDKEALNYHILLIENMNHYVEEVDGRNNIVLEEWRDRAAHDMAEHLKLYLDAVIRRPLGKLLDFIESIETLLPTVTPPSNIATRASHSRSTAKKVFGMFDSKEIRRGVEALKKRVEKHFGDADDPGLSRSLVSKVLRELESRYERVWERQALISDRVYEGMELEWKREDLGPAFRR